MAEPQNRYKQMELYVGCALGVDLLFFVIYMIAAGSSVIWLKVVCAVLVFLIGLAVVGYLYLTKELFKRRSQWMVVAAAALILCTLFSLILRFPCPNPLKTPEILELIK